MTPLDRLHARLATLGPIAVAVSGGIDSLTLATAAHRALGANAIMYHATSTAVPLEATERTRLLAAAEGWQLDVFDAGEFDDPASRENALNCCLVCQSSLFSSVASRTTRQIVSGTNLDDFYEAGPLLDAARQFGVRQPFVEAEIDKATVRRLAATLGLGAIADLPDTLCMFNRIATPLLEIVHQAEGLVSARLSPRAVRCHVSSPNGVRCIVIELDDQSLTQLDAAEAEWLQIEIQALAAPVGVQTVAFAAYRV